MFRTQNTLTFSPNQGVFCLCFLMIILCPSYLWATHNRAGEITYRQIDDLTIEATITTYTKASSVEADRDSLTICWGDGICDVLVRSNGPGNPPQGEIIENDSKINYYIGQHQYPTLGHYQIYMLDPNRNSGIVNIPNSVNIPFFLQTSVTLFNSQFQGLNNSPILLQPPIDVGCVGVPFIHTPNAYEVDGDSLVFELIVPQSDVNTPVPNYSFPDQIRAGPENELQFDPATGTIRWDSPQAAGEYNIAMRIIEFRDGRPIDSLIRDMQILIENCENNPPVVDVVDEICVVAGDTVLIDVTVNDPDSGQSVRLTATGGPFSLPNAAVLDAPDGFVAPLLEGTFTWVTTCEDIRDQPYTVVFRGVDDSTALADLKTLKIKVVAPPPEEPNVVVTDNGLRLTWKKPYSCDDTDNFFRGFSVWRQAGSNNFEPDTCETGLDGRGYERLVRNTTAMSGDSVYFYDDTDLIKGQTYCYRILGHFAGQSAGGFEFNRVASISSMEICFVSGRDLPALTHVDVQETDINDGIIKVAWINPDPTLLDTIQNPGPYQYRLQVATNPDGPFSDVPGATFTANSITAMDTTFEHSNLNTVANQYFYRLQFSADGDFIGMSPQASSIFLQVASGNMQLNLSWQVDVPWINDTFLVMRQVPNTSNFDTLASLNTLQYTDNNLENGLEVCYKIQSIGQYPSEEIEGTYLNHSQIVCGTPEDNEPPCPPVLSITNNCDQQDVDLGTVIQNELTVAPIINADCDAPVSFNYYFSEDSLNLSLLENNTATSLSHSPPNGLVGCYYVTALDSLNNESEPSNVICKDNCPVYELPNTFTPNGDNQNDIFKPRIIRFIERVEMKVFNVDGSLVFETTDPQLNWDGTNLSGNELSEGSYYYICTYFESGIEGINANPEPLSGYIMLIRGN